MKKKRMLNETHILRFSVGAGLVIAILEVILSFTTHSQAILMDGVFDTAEGIVAGLFVLLLPLIYKPETEKRPYGYAQLESIFMIGKGCALATITIQLIIDNIRIMMSGGRVVNSLVVGAFELFVCGFSIVVLYFLKHMNKHMNSLVVDAEILSWKIDIFCCLGVGLAFILEIFLNGTSVAFMCQYVDQVVAIVLALCMLPQPIKMVIDSLRSIVLLAPKEEVVERIKEVANNKVAGTGTEITFCDCVQTGRQIWVDIYVRSKENALNVDYLKELRSHMLENLQEEIEDIHLDITLDLD
nr:cation transporter [uncultured Cellulosilyticum sp.]